MSTAAVAAARSASKNLTSILQRFQAKELSKLRGAPKSARDPVTNIPVIRNPFIPTKTASGRWRAPEYSLRRQKELIKAAQKAGLDVARTLPVGPKTLGLVGSKKLQEAITKSAATAEKPDEQISTENSSTSTTKSKAKSQRRRRFVRPRVGVLQHAWSTVLPRSLAEKAGVVATTKPGQRVLRLYSGRKKAFKYHKWERNMRKRRGQIRVRLRDMRKRIGRFRSIYYRKRPKPLSQPKARKKETLPF